MIDTREARETVIQAFLVAVEAETGTKKRGVAEIAARMQLLFDFRDLKSPDKAMKRKSLETQIHEVKKQMREKS